MTTLLAFIATLALLIVVHEYGHYRVAVACGVKVLRFSVGFGRVIWRRQLGETEFALSALPLGGYVKMLDTREGEVPADDRSRAFDQRPLWQRSAIPINSASNSTGSTGKPSELMSRNRIRCPGLAENDAGASGIHPAS
jgi:RIP metalloprotease RseP